MRVDKLLFLLRFFKSRSLSQSWIATGHLRLNGQRLTRQDHAIVPGDVLTLASPSGVRIIEILELPVRRGPAPEAQACYRTLDDCQPIALAGAEGRQAKGRLQP